MLIVLKKGCRTLCNICTEHIYKIRKAFGSVFKYCKRHDNPFLKKNVSLVELS